MKIAIPLIDDRLAPRFGHCASFAIFDVARERKTITRQPNLFAPVHQPDHFPLWLERHGIKVVIANGMGKRAIRQLHERQIHTIVGAELCPPEKLVTAFVDGTLEQGDNLCDDCYTVKIQFTDNHPPPHP